MSARAGAGKTRRVMGWILIGVGLAFAIGFPLGGWAMSRTATSIAADNTPVNLRVVRLHANDGSYAPEFEVIEGPFAGRRNISNVSSNPPAHMEGDEVAGYIDPDTGTIQSEGTLGTLRFIGRIFTSVGLGLGGVLLAVGLVLLWLGRRAAAAAA